ncbi:GNAT family N-acetyltransferase [Paenibacillus motobuensis]|uniref:GNAT family N-acetyltransferase n=1 Tax=Paenibacillus motobuensis TaxID=295324 RepID=A0ABP3IDQ9_9BACL
MDTKQLSLQQQLRMKFPVLENERLRLRKIESEDSELLFQYVTDPLTQRHMSFQPDTLLFPKRLFRYFEETYRNLHDLHFAVIWKETGEVIGICSLQQWSELNGKARLGYLISPSFWNLGIATEAAGLLLRFGAEVLGLNEVEARCGVDNPASERVLQKLGLSFQAYADNSVGHRSDEYCRLKVYLLRL